MASLLNWAKEQFDYILVDSAPMGVVSDTTMVAPQCDGTVLVVETAKVPYRAAQGVVRTLLDANCNVLGAILNKVENAPGHSYKYKNYAYEHLEYVQMEPASDE